MKVAETVEKKAEKKVLSMAAQLVGAKVEMKADLTAALRVLKKAVLMAGMSVDK